jgi:addiction module HigA family antidote
MGGKMRIPNTRKPATPGEVLLQEFLVPLEISQTSLAASIRVPYRRVNEIVKSKRIVTPDTALRLAKHFNTTPEFWLNLQMRLDLYNTHQNSSKELKKIKVNGSCSKKEERVA